MNIFSKTLSSASLGLAAILFSAGTLADKHHWGYEGEDGPSHWAQLTPEYGECLGANQSPINLSHFVDAKLKKIRVEYHPGGSEIVNNGHAVQINYQDGSDIIVDGEKFKLLQFHFHAPSENLIDGVSYPMEGHFVHADENGKLAVLAVMFEYGHKNHNLEQLWNVLPSHTGEKHPLKQEFDATALLPANQEYYRFNGSLTTPPCSEGVTWLVMKHSVPVSKAQVKHFKEALGIRNNRPIQQLNARVVLQ